MEILFFLTKQLMDNTINSDRHLWIKSHLMDLKLPDVLSEMIVSYDYHFEGKFHQCLKGHKSTVTCLTTLRDGRIITGSDDKTIRIWNSKTGKCDLVLTGAISGVHEIIVLPDNRIITGSRDENILRIWDTQTGICNNTLAGHSDSISCLEMLVDNTSLLIASGSFDKTARIWDINTYRCNHILAGHKNYIYKIKNLSEKQIITSGSFDNTMRIWDTMSGDCLKVLMGHTNTVFDIIVLNDKIISAGDTTLRIWDIKNDEIKCDIIKAHTAWITKLYLTDDGVITISLDNTVKKWNLNTKKCEMILSKDNENPLIISPDHKLISLAYDNDLIFTIKDQMNDTFEKIVAECNNEHHTILYSQSLILLPDNKIATIFIGPDVVIWK